MHGGTPHVLRRLGGQGLKQTPVLGPRGRLAGFSDIVVVGALDWSTTPMGPDSRTGWAPVATIGHGIEKTNSTNAGGIEK